MSDEIIIVGEDSIEPKNWQNVLAPIRPAVKKNRYLDKIASAMDAGLYDAAINYMWDLVVNDLRAKVEAYGVDIFLHVEDKANYKENGQTLADRWHSVPDSILISGCQQIGIISRKAYRRLQHLLSIRNHESSAHPVEEIDEIDRDDAMIFIATCAKYVLADDNPIPGFNYVELMKAVKSQDLKDDLIEINRSIETVAQPISDNILGMLVAAYIENDAQTKSNVQGLLPTVWVKASEEARQKVGQKYAKLSSEGKKDEKAEVFGLLVLVGGVNYIPDDFLKVMYQRATSDLLTAHLGYDNFSQEATPARQLAELGANCPDDVLFETIESWLVSYIGNQWGYSHAAKPYLDRMRENFGLRHHKMIVECVRSSDNVQSEIWSDKPFKRLQQLIQDISASLVSAKDKEDTEFIMNKNRRDVLERFADA